MKLDAAELSYYKNWFTVEDKLWAMLLPSLIADQYSEEDVVIYFRSIAESLEIPRPGCTVVGLKVLKRSTVVTSEKGLPATMQLLTLELKFSRSGESNPQFPGTLLIRDIWGIHKDGQICWCPAKFVELKNTTLPDGTDGWLLKRLTGGMMLGIKGKYYPIGRGRQKKE